MDILLALLLRALHFLYALVSLLWSFYKRQTRPQPQLLQNPRQRLPKNLALVLVSDTNIPKDIAQNTVLESILNAIEWCRIVGIPKLTVYEEHGLIKSVEPRIREAIFYNETEYLSTGGDNEYRPLTPPPSDYSESRPLSPCRGGHDITNVTILNSRNTIQVKKDPIRSPITICLLSADSSKVAIAKAARSLYLSYKRKPVKGQRKKPFITVDIATLDPLLEDDNNLSSPDFMIIHPINPLQYNRTPLELHNFPPWHIRLTEIYQSKDNAQSRKAWLRSRLTYTPNPTPLDEVNFRCALDEFAAAEMRFGK